MQVLIIGASGYLGSAIASALQRRGHTVLGTARSDETARKLRETGIEPVSADITMPASLRTPAEQSDAVVYAVQYDGDDQLLVEGAALRAIVAALAGSAKPFAYTSGVWIYGNTGDRVADEDSPLNPTPAAAHRPQLERTVLNGANDGARAFVIRPGDVYGAGGGLPAMWVQSVAEAGAVRYVGDGRNHWPTVHRDDLAELYALALEHAQGGSIYNASDERAFTVAQMAEAASYGAGCNGAIVEWPLEEARQRLGPFADALALDSRVTARRARETFGWATRSTTILDDLRGGSYAES